MRISVFAQFDKRLALEANTIALHGAGVVVVYDVDVYRNLGLCGKPPPASLFSSLHHIYVLK